MTRHPVARCFGPSRGGPLVRSRRFANADRANHRPIAASSLFLLAITDNVCSCRHLGYRRARQRVGGDRDYRVRRAVLERTRLGHPEHHTASDGGCVPFAFRCASGAAEYPVMWALCGLFPWQQCLWCPPSYALPASTPRRLLLAGRSFIVNWSRTATPLAFRWHAQASCCGAESGHRTVTQDLVHHPCHDIT